MNLFNVSDVKSYSIYAIINYLLTALDVINSSTVKLLEPAMVLKVIIVYLMDLILYPGASIVSLVFPKIKFIVIEEPNVSANTV